MTKAEAAISGPRDELTILWIAKLGRSEIADILKQLSPESRRDHGSLLEKSYLVVDGYGDSTELDRLILAGFYGPYHQTAYLYRPNDVKQVPSTFAKQRPFRSRTGAIVPLVDSSTAGPKLLVYVPHELRFIRNQAVQRLNSSFHA